MKFFLTYLGVLLAFSIVLVVIVKQFASGFAGGGKKPVIYGTFSSVIASLAAYVATLFTQHLFTVYWFLAGIFFLFGVIHTAIVHKKYFYSTSEDRTKVIIGEIFFGLSIIFFTIVVFSSLQYFLKDDKAFLYYPMLMSMLAFFIPFLIGQTFDAAYKIPSATFKTWAYPLHEPLDLPDEDPREKILVIGFEIAKKIADKKKTYFRAKAPEGMRLGDLYYYFINDYNELQSETTIEFTDKDYSPCEWWFRRKPKWYQKQRILDPDITVRENRIRENTVIICERILN
jgi:hypothetical protein